MIPNEAEIGGSIPENFVTPAYVWALPWFRFQIGENLNILIYVYFSRPSCD